MTCWTTDLSWDATPMPEYQSPTFLNVERLKEGTEAIYFYYNFTYHGRGTDGKVTNFRIDRACGEGYLEQQKRYNYSCSILRSCTEKLSPTGKTAYVACPLRRIEGIEKWTGDDWEGFIDAVKDEMAFPFKLTLTYDEEFSNTSISRGKTHVLCSEVGYVVDAAIINPKDVLPDWLLYDFVDFLNSTIETLNRWTQTIREILEWVAIGCMVSVLLKFVVQISRRLTCHYDRFFKNLARVTTKSSEQEDSCRACVQQYESSEVMKKFDEKKDIQNLLSDTCLKECYPSCAGSWGSEASLYTTYRWACDRVFGHPTPSRWTETATDTELSQKLQMGSSCANDQSVRGRPLRAISCKNVEEKYRIRGTFDEDDKCLEITSHGKARTETLYYIEGTYSEGEDVYKISKRDTSAPSITYDFVIKQNEDNYLAPLEQTCDQMCRGETTGESVQIGLVGGSTTTGEKFRVEKGLKSQQIVKEDGVSEEEKNDYMTYGCETPNNCISYRTGDRTIKIEGKDQQVDVQTAIPMGYTQDCFDPQYVSSDPDTRIECCCINSKEEEFPEYYKPEDVESKEGKFGNTQLENMKWSYRYSKPEVQWEAKSGATKYNPNRYIEGRDYPACFGQNDWLYDGFTTQAAGTGNLMIIDPAKQHLAAFQCIAISQILNRLILLKNIMVALENCVLSIRTTGQADTGVCKEIFTQYICSFIWKIISWIRNGCLPFGEGIDFTKSDNQALEALSVGMSGLWDSVADSQQELAHEYGNAELNNLIGVGEQEVFRIWTVL